MNELRSEFVLEAEKEGVVVNVTTDNVAFKETDLLVAHIGVNVYDDGQRVEPGQTESNFRTELNGVPIGVSFRVLKNFQDCSLAYELVKGENIKVTGILVLSIVYKGIRYIRFIMMSTIFDGQKGQRGREGCICRTTEWEAGKDYLNELESEKESIRYIDNVAVVDSNQQVEYYECKVNHRSSDANRPPNSLYWQRIKESQPTRTPLIIADNAVIRFTQTNSFYVVDDNGKIILKQGGGEYPIMMGDVEQGPKKCPYKVDKAGHIFAEGATISGTINADRGHFRGFITRGITTITPENYLEYSKIIRYEFDDGMSLDQRVIDFPKLSNIVYVNGNFGSNQIPVCYLPALIPSGTYTQEQKDEARSYVGTVVEIYNYSNTNMGVTSNCIYEADDPNVPASATVPPKSVCRFECKSEWQPKKERIYWLFKVYGL